ncbi:MAG: glycosyltransferase family 2 protein [Bacteroidales bacterium]
MEIIAYAASAYLLVQLAVVLINLFTRIILRPALPKEDHMVSVLIPARNEEANIGPLLDDLLDLDYPKMEILVYDDDSSDGTAGIVRARVLADSRVKYLKGEGPLPGWLGKNHACHQLARQAGGEYLLFLDADVRVRRGIIAHTLAYLQKYNLALLSLFPVQVMKSFGEWLTVPLMNRILLGNLPLIFIRKIQLPDFTAANGQFMLFDATIYKQHWFHKLVNDEKVEDIRIMRMVKKLGYKGQTLLSDGQVSCRMYRSYAEGLSGFARNINAFFGKNWLILLAYLLLTSAGPVAVWLAFPLPVFVAYLAILVLVRIIISIESRQSWWRNTLLMPLQQASLLTIAAIAGYRHLTGQHTWKGRKV